MAELRQATHAKPELRMRRRPEVVVQFLAGLALALPWLNPLASGPSPSVVPWLVSLACVGIFLLLVLKGPNDVAELSARWRPPS